METTTYLCIGCPLGCRLEVDEDESGEIVEVRGFSCKRGKEYAVQEHTDPRRTLTTTVAIDGAIVARLPVKSSQAIPKGQVQAACTALRTVRVHAPVRLGDVIVADVLGSGADIVATRDVVRGP